MIFLINRSQWYLVGWRAEVFCGRLERMGWRGNMPCSSAIIVAMEISSHRLKQSIKLMVGSTSISSVFSGVSITGMRKLANVYMP